MRLETKFFEEGLRILHDESVDDVVSEYMDSAQDESVMLFNIGDMVQKVKNWKLKMPRVKPFYAVKCNPNPTVLKVLAALGTGFDCASKAEMRNIVDLGVNPSRIIYAHTVKPKSHIKEAAALGINTMTFDNESELYKVKSVFPTARLVLRIRCDAKDSQCNLGMKFGANPEEIEPLLATVKALGLNFVGVSFHVGSGCREPHIYYEAIQRARDVFDLANSLGYSPYLLDVGGGFPGNLGTSIDEYAKYINRALQEFFPDDDVHVIAEPGRYIVASAFSLLTSVTAKREVEKKDQRKKMMYYLNDGVYGSFNGILFDHQTPKPIVIGNALDEKKKNIPLFESQIWGPTCDSVDEVIKTEMLPELNVGEWLLWRDMGAYTLPSMTTFNGFPGPNIHLVVPYHTLLLEDILNDKGQAALDKCSPLEPKGNQCDYPKIPSTRNLFEKDQDCHLMDQVKIAANITTLRVLEI
ncbi:Antizyme inhibitor 2 [Armadillidium nasatum]|uniref:ornithine decarboxylase n=1 Tax=Armadillidium nasatum TaxID=96803 RepID=A0A5N5SQP6_9CRUS|nr:Antizyme inhibitor 2 [Armadillidium nasatum]